MHVHTHTCRCRDNPSCRLLYGAPSASPPIAKAGPLVLALRAAGHDAEFCFQSLPVIWGTSAACDVLSYDMVVHLGLGVYDGTETILLESGAWNERRGLDALGKASGCTLDAGAPQVLTDQATAANVGALAGGARLAGGHAVQIAEARPANAYICNETNWRALKVRRGVHGVCMACGWRVHGACVACAWRADGMCIACAHSGMHIWCVPLKAVRHAADETSRPGDATSPPGDEVRLRAAYFVHLPCARMLRAPSWQCLACYLGPL